MMKSSKFICFLKYFTLSGLALISVVPFIWMLSTSFKSTLVLFSYPPEFIPKKPTFQNYVTIFIESGFVFWLRNSIIVSGATTIFAVIFNSMAAYSFAKKDFLGRDILFILILATLMIPPHALMVPLYLMISKLNLANTYAGLTIPFIANAFGIFLMRQYMLTIPNELIDAAKIDGASEFTIFMRVIMPLCKPAIAALSIFIFMFSWNNFIWPLILTTTDKMRTLPVGLAVFQGQYITEWGVVMAGATVTFVPVLMVFLLLQKYFVQGITLSGLKG